MIPKALLLSFLSLRVVEQQSYKDVGLDLTVPAVLDTAIPQIYNQAQVDIPDPFWKNISFDGFPDGPILDHLVINDDLTLTGENASIISVGKSKLPHRGKKLWRTGPADGGVHVFSIVPRPHDFNQISLSFGIFSIQGAGHWTFAVIVESDLDGEPEREVIKTPTNKYVLWNSGQFKRIRSVVVTAEGDVEGHVQIEWGEYHELQPKDDLKQLSL